MNRLAALRGLTLETAQGPRHAFPRPEDLAAAPSASLRRLGFSGSKARALIEAGREVASGRLDLEALAALDNEQAIERLEGLRGVGRWTAEYALLRGMGRIDLFPGDDIGARNSLERWMRLRRPLDYGRVAHLMGKWKPYGGLIYFHLLLDGLERAGYVRAGSGGVEELRARSA